MYNKALKTKFIREYTKNISRSNICKKIFDVIGKYETKFDADFCTLPESDLKRIFDNEPKLLLYNTNQTTSVLCDYVRWCVKTGVAGAVDTIFTTEIAQIDKVRKSMVSSPSQLQYYLDEMFYPESELTTDNILRGFCWLSFSGLRNEEIIKLSSSNIDIPNLSIVYDEREYHIYREAISSINNCIQLDRFIYINPNYSKSTYRQRAAGDIIMRGTKGIPSFNALKTALSKKVKEMSKKNNTVYGLGIKKIWLSGHFYRMLEKEMSGFEVDFSILARQDFEAYSKTKTYNLRGLKYSEKTIINKTSKKYLTEYRKWKSAFLRL